MHTTFFMWSTGDSSWKAFVGRSGCPNYVNVWKAIGNLIISFSPIETHAHVCSMVHRSGAWSWNASCNLVDISELAWLIFCCPIHTPSIPHPYHTHSKPSICHRSACPVQGLVKRIKGGCIWFAYTSEALVYMVLWNTLKELHTLVEIRKAM